MIILMFLFALALSGVAAFYSIVGLVAIFAASPVPIMVMGTILEGSKLVVASWLYRNWSQVPFLMKTYFVTALTVLMFLTSMGIFGFLSKAHIEQGVPTGDIAAQIALIDERILIEQENINANRQALAQLDNQIAKFTELGAVSKGVAAREAQRADRDALLAGIGTAQGRIAELNGEKAPLSTQLRSVEAEVGPLKYIAALIYGDEKASDQTFLEKSVRWVIILIVAVFDPLAVIMLIAANWSLVARQRERAAVADVQTPPVVEAPVAPEVVVPDPKSEPAPYVPEVRMDAGTVTPVVKAVKKRVPVKRPALQPQPEPEVYPDPVSRAVAERYEPTEEDMNNPEHPAFNPNSRYWGSRPKHHLVPIDVRKPLPNEDDPVDLK